MNATMPKFEKYYRKILQYTKTAKRQLRNILLHKKIYSIFKKSKNKKIWMKNIETNITKKFHIIQKQQKNK